MKPIDVDYKVCGIPCIIRVISWEKYVPPYLSGPIECWSPADGGFGEWEVLDRNGRPAPWLERKLTDHDREKVGNKLFEVIEDVR